MEYFEKVNEGINYIKKIRFQKTIIIISQELFPDFYESLRKNVKEMYVLPKIIIFNEINEAYDSEKYNTTIPINDEFYNIGGIKNNKEELLAFVESSINKYKPEFEKNIDNRIKNEELKYQLISNKDELIVPIFYSEYIKNSKQIKIKECIGNIFKSNENIIPLGFIFSQLNESGNIPMSILSKFLIRAYSTHQNFSSKMNQELLNKNFNDYLPIIQILYKSVYNCYLNFEYSHKLYKYFIDKKNNWETFFNNFNQRRSKFPKAILYGYSFFSFYYDESLFDNMIGNFKKKNSNDEVIIKIILEGTQNLRNVSNNTIINKELSYFEDEKEILFFPFSCFEIKKIDKDNEKHYTIILNYLSRDIFNNEDNRYLSKEPENEISKVILNSGLIDKESLIKKDNTNTSINQNIQQSNNNSEKEINNLTSSICSYNNNNNQLTVFSQIDNINLMSLVKGECDSAISQNISSINDLDKLKEIIKKKLMDLNEGNWYVNVCKEKMDNFGTIDKRKLMIFQYNNLSNNFYIHVANL